MGVTLDTINIVNWEKFQHYSDRRQIWIKLYIDLLDDYDYCLLNDDCKLLLHHLWLLASCYQNATPYDLTFLKRRIPIHTSRVSDKNIQLLQQANFIGISHASKTLSPCYQDAILEKSRIEKSRVDNNSQNKFGIPSLSEVLNYIKEKDYAIDGSQFYNYYNSNGWKVGKNQMKCWKSACSCWNTRENGTKTKKVIIKAKEMNYE